MHAELAVDDSVGIVPHSRRADGVSEAAATHPHELDEVLLALGIRTWDEFSFANPVEGLLAHQFPRGLRASHSRLEIATRAQEIRFDSRRNAPIRARQLHSPAARGLNQGRGDRE